MTRFWLVLGSLAAALAVGFATLNAISLLAHEEVTEVATFPADGITRLDLRSDHGSVEVIGTDTDEVRVVAEISHGLRRTGHRVAVEGESLVVRSSCPLFVQWCEVDYHIEVPATLAADLDVDDGRLVVRDLRGAVRVGGDDGSIELTRLSGDIDASTDNGSVVGSGLRSQVVRARSDNGRVALSFAEAPRTVDARTHNGSVEVVVPDDSATYDVDLATRHGSTDAGVRTDPDSDRTITGRAGNGSVRVRYPTG